MCATSSTHSGPSADARAVASSAARVGLRLPWSLGLLALFSVAITWHFAYLARLRHTPFWGGLEADSRIYWDWSEFILRHGPVPPGPFFLAPLYPYALAGLRAVGGGGIGHVLEMQALLGAVSVVLLADATRRLAGRSAALVVGGILALYQGTTFFDGLVLPESLLFLVGSLLVWFVARTDWSRAGTARFAAYGVLAGMLALGRASDAVLLAAAAPLAWASRVQPGLPLRRFGAAVATFAACCLLSTLANVHASHELIPITYNLGFNLYVGNNPDANGAYVDITGGSLPVPLAGTSPTTGGALDGRAFVLATEGRRLSAAGSSAYWAGKAAAFIRSSPLQALGLMGKKFLLAWSYREIPQIETMQSFDRAAGPLGLPLFGTFGFLAVLGVAGAARAARRGPAERWLVAYVVLMSLALVPFFVTERYRHHLVPALAVLAGIAVAEIGQAVHGGAHSGRARLVLTLALAAGLVCAPMGIRQRRPGDWAFAADRAMRLLDRGSYAEAADGFSLAEASLGEVQLQGLGTSARTDLASFYFRYGIALEALGRSDEAISRWELASTLDPNDAASLGRLCLAYERTGKTSDALRVRRTLVSVPGGRGQLLVHDGWAAAGSGDLAGAERQFLDAVQAAPNLSIAWEGLIRVRIQTGRFEEASRALDQGRGAGLDPLPADIYDCYLAVQRGDPGGARRILDRIPSATTPQDPVLARLLDHSRRALEREAGPP